VDLVVQDMAGAVADSVDAVTNRFIGKQRESYISI